MYFSAFGKVTAASASAAHGAHVCLPCRSLGPNVSLFIRTPITGLGPMPIQEDLVLTASAKSISKRGQILGSQVDAKFGGHYEPRMCTRMCSIPFSSHFGVSLQRYLTGFLSGCGSLVPGLTHARCFCLPLIRAKCRTFLCCAQRSRKPTRRCGCSA